MTTTVYLGAAPPNDPECFAVIAGLPPFPAMTAETFPSFLRAGDAEWNPPATDEQLTRGGTWTVEDVTVPGSGGRPEIGLVICRPATSPAPMPTLYYTHGGGMVSGSARTGLAQLLDLADTVGAAVVSVEYRLAPETPHPGPVEDCYAGLVWTAQHGGELSLDPDRLVLIGGSAGGGIAAALALMARDRGGPTLAGQLLMCPMLDDRNDAPSTHQLADGPIWNRAANELGWSALLGDARAGNHVSPYAAPARASDLAGLPPAFIDVGSTDLFRDEDVAYAARIWQAGGIADLHVWPGGFHGFDGIAPHAALSRAAVAARANWLCRLLGT